MICAQVEVGTGKQTGWDVFANTVPERRADTFLSSLIGARHSFAWGRGGGAAPRRALTDVPKRLVRSCGHRGDWAGFEDYCIHAVWDDEYQSRLCGDVGDSQHLCGLIETTRVDDGPVAARKSARAAGPTPSRIAATPRRADATPRLAGVQNV